MGNTNAAEPSEDRPTWGWGALAKNDAVTPSREAQNRRSTDASKLTFPLQLVIVIVGGTLATTGAFWASTAQIRADSAQTRADLAVMTTQQHEEQRVRDLERKLADERYDSLKAAVSAITASQRLEEIRNQEMRVTIATMGAKK